VRSLETRTEGIQQLQLAARGLPTAHRTLADVYRASGEIELAKEEIERYLATDPKADRADVERWIATLR
jgi:hypothetical protein